MALAGWLALGAGAPVVAATLLETSEVLSATAEAAAQLPPAREFTLTEAGTFVVTLADLGVPLALRGPDDLEVAPLRSLQALITHDLETVAKLEIEYPAGGNVLQLPATQSFAGTPGVYRVHVIGAIAADEAGGWFSIDVTPSAGGNAVFEAADAIASPGGPSPGQSVLTTTFTTPTAGAYRVRALDRMFPTALSTRDVLVLRTAPTLGVVVNSQGLPFSTADVGTFNAGAGDTYELIVIANAAAGQAGLYGAIVQGGPSNAVIYSSENTVGPLPPPRTFDVASAGSHSLTLADLEFPEPLQSFSAAVIQNHAFVGSVTGAVPGSLTLSAGTAELFVHATTATTGALSATLSQGAQVDYADVHIVDSSPDASTPAVYSFTPSQAVAAGNYALAVADLRFPEPLPSVHTAVVQGAALVHRSDAPGSEPVTLQAGPVRVLVAATPPPAFGTTPGNGVFTVALTAQPGNAPVLESTQGVGGLFTARLLNIPAAGRYDVVLKDFEFPERLRTGWLVVTRGATMVGQVIGSSSIPNLQLEAGTYVLNLIGQPAESASYGTFGLKVADSAPVPVVTLTASPASITSGRTSTLEWTATHATSCTASNGWSGTKAPTGQQATDPLIANTTFDIECVGPGGRATASATVTVTAAAPRNGGGGSVDPFLLVSLLGLLAWTILRPERQRLNINASGDRHAKKIRVGQA